ncbi:hypothetical protein [Rosistilla oblonga]|uniref:hypothetical protein n=1 Tax=Rosistilla oblonga TaxID=2527990 RepID=UPI003A986EAA
MSRKSAIQDWISAIADKANLDVSEIENVLACYRIEPMPIASAPKHLSLNRLRFTGTKNIDENEFPIDFNWDGLKPGLCGILSGVNFRGKSTIIQVIRGCLRGSLSQTVQADVFGWLRTVELDFQIDEQYYQLRVELGELVSGALTRIYESGRSRKFHSFNDEEEFETAMSNFFMKQLGFDKFAVHRTQNASSTTTLHGWPAMCSAMFIGTKYDTLIGELSPLSGVPVRLLQLFLGIPWVTTLAATSAAFKEEQRKQSASDQMHDDAKDVTERRLSHLRDELADKESRLTQTAVTASLQSDMKACGESLREATNREIAVRRQLRQAVRDLEDTESAVSEDRKALRQHEEESSSVTVFRALDPKNCPRCETVISAERKRQEQSKNSCAVCGKQVHSDIDEAEVKDQLTKQLDASKKGQKAAKKRLKELNTELAEIEKAIESATTRQAKLAKRLTRPSKRGQLLTDVAELKARIDELSKTVPEASRVSTDARVLKIIEDLTRLRMKEHQTKLLELISIRICAYAQRFGMTQLDSVALNGGLNLSVVKSGSATSYSKLTDGERLRLKVATLLAMIAVGEEENVGRYPGLLVIDSPAAQEVVSKDLEQIISGLAEIAAEIDHLQVFIGSRSSSVICKHIPETLRVQAQASDYLW